MLSAWIWPPESPGRRTEGGRKEGGEGKMYITPASYLQGCYGAVWGPLTRGHKVCEVVLSTKSSGLDEVTCLPGITAFSLMVSYILPTGLSIVLLLNFYYTAQLVCITW